MIDRTWWNALVDDDGSGLTGSVWDKTDIATFMNEIDKTQAACSCFRNAPMDFGHNVTAAVLWDGEDSDPLAMHAPGVANIVLPYTGIWQLSMILRWQPNASGVRAATFMINGTSPLPGYSYIKGFLEGADGPFLAYSIVLPLPQSTQVAVWAYQNSGISQQILSGSRFAVNRVS